MRHDTPPCHLDEVSCGFLCGMTTHGKPLAYDLARAQADEVDRLLDLVDDLHDGDRSAENAGRIAATRARLSAAKSLASTFAILAVAEAVSRSDGWAEFAPVPVAPPLDPDLVESLIEGYADAARDRLVSAARDNLPPVALGKSDPQRIADLHASDVAVARLRAARQAEK